VSGVSGVSGTTGSTGGALAGGATAPS
jgi:hypothetical protein